MCCCPKGIFTPLVTDCAGNTALMPFGGLLRGGDFILGGDIVSITAPVTLSTNAIVLADTTKGNITITLPPAEMGLRFIIKRTYGSVNSLTVDAYGSETIDGSTTKILPNQYDTLYVLSDNNGWWIL